MKNPSKFYPPLEQPGTQNNHSLMTSDELSDFERKLKDDCSLLATFIKSKLNIATEETYTRDEHDLSDGFNGNPFDHEPNGNYTDSWC